jgi:hypothetical protein
MTTTYTVCQKKNVSFESITLLATIPSVTAAAQETV